MKQLPANTLLIEISGFCFMAPDKFNSPVRFYNKDSNILLVEMYSTISSDNKANGIVTMLLCASTRA